MGKQLYFLYMVNGHILITFVFKLVVFDVLLLGHKYSHHSPPSLIWMLSQTNNNDKSTGATHLSIRWMTNGCSLVSYMSFCTMHSCQPFLFYCSPPAFLIFLFLSGHSYFSRESILMTWVSSVKVIGTCTCSHSSAGAFNTVVVH